MDNATALQLCLERDRLLSDPEFARSPTMCKLLRFLVDHRLSENSVPLKSYTIAVDGLGRDADFDPQADSYPRVQMGRLRRMLDHFYLRKGGENRLTIAPNQYEIVVEPLVQQPAAATNTIDQSRAVDTQGEDISHTPEFQSPDIKGDDRPRSPRRYIAGFRFAIFVMLASVLAYLLWPDPNAGSLADKVDYPKIALDFPATPADPRENELSESIANHLVRGLNGFGGIRFFYINASPSEKSGYLLRMRFLNTSVNEIELRLLDRESGEILWSRKIGTSDEAVLRRELDRAIVSLVGNYGIILQTEISKVGDDFSAGYPCLLQFDRYIRYREQEKLKRLRNCLKKSVRRFPRDAYLLSMAALARNLAEQTAPSQDVKGLGMIIARRAEALDHNSAAANFAIAQSAFFAGDCATGVAWGQKAVALNPLNSAISGYLGLYMISCDMPEGEGYAARALESDSNADPTIAAAVALQMIKRGDAVSARDLSVKYMASSLEKEPALELTYILSSAMLKDKAEARRAWKALAEQYGLSETTPPREVLKRLMSNPALMDDVMRVADRSGLFSS